MNEQLLALGLKGAASRTVEPPIERTYGYPPTHGGCAASAQI